MKQIVQKLLTGERALFGQKDTEIVYCTFADGESPLKESAIYFSAAVSSDGSIRCGTAATSFSADAHCSIRHVPGIWYTENISLSVPR